MRPRKRDRQALSRDRTARDVRSAPPLRQSIHHSPPSTPDLGAFHCRVLTGSGVDGRRDAWRPSGTFATDLPGYPRAITTGTDLAAGVLLRLSRCESDNRPFVSG